MSQHLLVRSVLTGAVSPEASEVGSVGDVYVRTDDATLWIKMTGDDTDTGWQQSANISGDLPFSNFVQASAASRLVGRGSASGAGDFQEITLGSNLSMTGTVLSATSGAGGGDVDGPASAVDDRIATFDGATGKLIQDSGDTIADVIADAVTAATAAIVPVDLSADVSGDLPFSSLVPASAASKLVGRGAGGGAGDFGEITLGTNLSMSGATLNATGGGGGVVVQQVNTQTGAVASGSTLIPFDDTIPQNGEGDQYLSLTITPTNASNILRIEVVVFATASGTPWITVALFQDSTANALAVTTVFSITSTAGGTIPLDFRMIAGTTSATTFKVRIGASSGGGVTLNGQSGGRIFGGAAASSLTITELTP